MTGLREQAVAAFEKDVKRREAAAKRNFKKDFGADPDEVVYLGDHRFLFKADGLHIKGYIEYIGSHLYGKSYRLACPCPHCEKLIVDENSFFGLVGLGEAIKGHRDWAACNTCGRVLID